MGPMSQNSPTDWAQALAQLQSQFSSHLQTFGRGEHTLGLVNLGDWLQTLGGGGTLGAPATPPNLFALAPWPGARAPDRGHDNRWNEAALRYHEALAAMQQAWLEIGTQTWDQLREALNDDEAPDDIRGVYDLWICCGEQVFAHHAHSERYGALVSELINAQVAWHLACGIGNEPAPDDPAQLKDALATAHAREAQLRADLEALREAQSAMGADTTGTKRKKTPTRKKAAKKASGVGHPKHVTGGDETPRKKAVRRKKKSGAKTGRDKDRS